MKILIDGRLIDDKETGISRYTEELLKIYIELFGSENITIVVDYILKKEFNNINVIRTELHPFNIVHFLKFHKILESIEFDVYHSMFYANSFFKIKDKIYITTVHDLMYRVVPNFFRKSVFINQFAILYYNFIVKRSLKNSTFVIAISNTTKKDIKNIFFFDSHLITEGINELQSNNENLKIDTEAIRFEGYFLYVGNDRPHKNIDFLKQCYLASNTIKKLVIVGHKGKSVKFDKKEIIYTDYVSDHTLKYLYQNASAFVFPSLYEGFGLPVLESINLNTLVLSSNSASLKEFGEYNIQYFNPYKEEELIELLENIDNVEFNYNKKDELLSRFNWKIVKKQVKEFYKEIGLIK